MKEIMEQYGNTMLAMLVGVAIYLFLGQIGAGGFLGQTLGRFVSGRSENMLVEQGTAAYQTYGVIPVPKVELRDMTLYIRERINLEDCFQVTNSCAGTLDWKVLSLRNAGGETCPVETQEGRTYLYFQEPGIYELCLETWDSYAKRRVVMLSVPVQTK